MYKQVRFIGSVTTTYVLTIGLLAYTLLPSQLFSTPVHGSIKPLSQTSHKPDSPRFVVISGKPVRITIPDYGIDLPVDDGSYNSATGLWTLSDTHAQFATMTANPNNYRGNTFIYGHGTDAVFGKIGSNTPQIGTIARVYTANNHVFLYKFLDARSLAPTDTEVFNNIMDSQPTLTVQTCTGIFSEWRTMFRFAFERLEQ